MGGGASRWRRPAPKIGFPCAFLVGDASPPQNPSTILNSVVSKSSVISESINGEEHGGFPAKQNPCAICLEPLLFNEGVVVVVDGGGGGGGGGGSKIFTAPCSHAFHLPCIASNIRHGGVTCPICRAPWPRLPRDLLAASRPPPPLKSASTDPILRILDDSIATSRVNRRSSLRSARYNDDDPTEPHNSASSPARLLLSLVRSSAPSPPDPLLLLLRLAPQPPLDLIVVAAPNGSHLRLLKQAAALAVFSLRPADRLALVASSPAAAARAFALRRMSSAGKRAALRAIDRLSFAGEAGPAEGLEKAARILEDRAHRNPISRIVHLSDAPAAGGAARQVDWFRVGASGGFEEFLKRVIGEEVGGVELRIGREERAVRVGDLRCGEERRIPVDLGGEAEAVRVRYEYREGGGEGKVVGGEVVVGIGEEGGEEGMGGGGVGPRRSCAEGWGYLDPFMATRWAKHLHGCRA